MVVGYVTELQVATELIVRLAERNSEAAYATWMASGWVEGGQPKSWVCDKP